MYLRVCLESWVVMHFENWGRRGWGWHQHSWGDHLVVVARQSVGKVTVGKFPNSISSFKQKHEGLHGEN